MISSVELGIVHVTWALRPVSIGLTPSCFCLDASEVPQSQYAHTELIISPQPCFSFSVLHEWQQQIPNNRKLEVILNSAFFLSVPYELQMSWG